MCVKAYRDTNLVSALGKEEIQTDLAALKDLLNRFRNGSIALVTSEVTGREIQRYRGSKKPDIEAIYDELAKVPFVEAHEVKDVSDYWDEHGGWSYPICEDDPIWLKLHNTGLDTPDAHHVMLAIRSNCDKFLTCDKRTILRYRSQIEAAFSIRLMQPSQLVPLLSPP